MATKKKKTEKFVSPVGIAKYCYITEPQTTFDPNGVFNVTLVVSEEEAKGLMGRLDEQLEIAYQEALDTVKPQKKASLVRNEPYAPEYSDEGAPTGNIEFKFKQPAKGKRKDGSLFDRVITIVDSKRSPMQGAHVGSGSKLKVAFSASPYYMAAQNAYGVTCYIQAVQVIELNSFADSGADSFEEEEGFEVTVDTPSTNDASNSSEDYSDPDFDE